MVNRIWQESIKSGYELKQALCTIFSKEGCRLISYINEPDAYEKFTKAMISNLEFLSLIPAINGVFDKCIGTLNALKDLYYTTLTIVACACFIEKDADGKPVGFQLPRHRAADGGGINWSAFFWSLSAFFDTAQFLRKHQIYEFAAYFTYITPLGNYSVYFKLNEIPVVNTLFDGRPREFFIILASIADLVKDLKAGWKLTGIQHEERDKFWIMKKWETLLKVSASTGRIIGMTCYRYFPGARWLVVVGLISNNANIFKIILGKERSRQEHLAFPR